MEPIFQAGKYSQILERVEDRDGKSILSKYFQPKPST